MCNNYNDVSFINNFRGEMASEYRTHLNYVEMGGWEKDYFSSWLEGCSDYPYLGEIADFCRETDAAILVWLEGVEAGAIDPEASYEE